MFEKFKSALLKRTAPTLQIQAEEDDLSPFENPNFITDHNKIVSLLAEIEGGSPLCTIQIDGAPEDYSSSILGIKADKNLIIIDELTPGDGNRLLQTQKSLKLSTFHKGIHLSFGLSAIETGSSHGIAYYKAAIPGRVYYPQRRRSPRIEISAIDIKFSGISERTGISVSGRLFDLSRSGAGVDVTANRARIQRGDLIKQCRINVDDHDMEFDFAVRFVKSAAPNSPRVQMGGLFENLSNKSQAKLSYFVASLERMEIRKQKA